MADCCECGNEPSLSIKMRGISRLAEDLLASQGGPCCMEFNLVSVDIYRNRCF